MVPHLEHTELMVVVAAAVVYMWESVEHAKRKNATALTVQSLWRCIYMLHAINIELTFAGPHALKPPVINVSAAGPSAVLKPSTARSAATDSTGFLERAALGTRHCIRNR